jgi:hypothetical protein
LYNYMQLTIEAHNCHNINSFYTITSINFRQLSVQKLIENYAAIAICRDKFSVKTSLSLAAYHT